MNANIERGLLHRAFSVFLFDGAGRLLLQQRSDKKITFPLFWANTCCSHPLHMAPEMELEGALGVKRAAVRKLGQELGIPPEELPIEGFRFLTRIHYVALEAGDWGEHEIDHVLVMQTASPVTLRPEPNEVREVRYFSEPELGAFLDAAEANGDKVSPWFAHIRRLFLGKWWQALREGSLHECEDLETIHRIGDANAEPDASAEVDAEVETDACATAPALTPAALSS